jgi:hypothetical protein
MRATTISGAPQEDGVAGEDDEDDDAGRQIDQVRHGSTSALKAARECTTLRAGKLISRTSGCDPDRRGRE